ncbi:hypothetical protein OS187_07750 [Xanthomonadaceae bacterium JHOS43]|nr:hypothetical protein [Xanthomonadaceae bacterium JHOS43]
MKMRYFIMLMATIISVSACTSAAIRHEAADPLFLKVAMSPSDFEGQEIVVRAWITLRHEDKNLWATRQDHENWETVHCISLINYDSLDPSLDGRYVEVTGVVRSDASNGGNLLRFASCREVAIEVAGPSAIRLITR